MRYIIYTEQGDKKIYFMASSSIGHKCILHLTEDKELAENFMLEQTAIKYKGMLELLFTNYPEFVVTTK